jgi:hypothetical protein
MSRQSIVLSTILICLLGIYAIGLRLASVRQNANRLFAGIDPVTAETFTAAARGHTAILTRSADKTYTFSSPFAGVAADAEATEEFLSAWKQINVSRRLGSVEPSALTKYGITDTSPALTLESRGKKQTITFGDHSPVAPAIYAFDPEKKDLLLIDEAAAQILEVMSPEYFRNNRILPVPPGDIEVLSWRKPGGKERRLYRESDFWYLAADGKTLLAENAAVTNFLRYLTAVRITDFSAADDPGRAAAAQSQARSFVLDVAVASAAVVHLEFGAGGNAKKTAVFSSGAFKGSAPVADITLQLSTATPFFVREAVINVHPGKIVAFTVTGGESAIRYEKKRGVWYRLGKKKRAQDTDKMKAFIQILSALRIEEFLPDGRELGAVFKEYRFYDRDKNEIAGFALGDTEGASVKARITGTKAIFFIKKELVDALTL